MPRKKDDIRKNRQPVISVIALIIAICGGIPGIISTLNYFLKNKPIFGFDDVGVLSGTLSDSNTPILALFGTVTNHGDKPLNPKVFDLKIKVDDKWLSLESVYLPKDINCVFNSSTQQITIKDFAKINLQEWKEPIFIGQPARGCLVFGGNEFNIDKFRSGSTFTYQLTCTDIFNKRYTVTSTRSLFGDFRNQQKLIKFDVTFGPKN
jgi:hypothetical protein